MTHRRRGVSLLELIVALTTGSVVMGIGVGLLILLTRMEHSMRAWREDGRSETRLIEQFRQDCRAARDIDLPAGEDDGEVEARWRVVLAPGRDVVYEQRGRTVERRLRQGSEDVARESYPFSGDVRVTVGKEEDMRLVTLRIEPVDQPEASGPRRRGWSAVARLGSDHRWHADEEE